MFTAVVVYTWNTWLGCARGGEETQIHDWKYNIIRTIDPPLIKVLNPNRPNVFVQNGDAADNSSSKRQVIDYIYEAGPEKIN